MLFLDGGRGMMVAVGDGFCVTGGEGWCEGMGDRPGGGLPGRIEGW